MVGAMKKLLWVALLLGLLHMLLAVIFAAISTLWADVVGGAEWPTFVFYLKRFAWMAWIGALFVSASAARCLPIRNNMKTELPNQRLRSFCPHIFHSAISCCLSS